MIIIAYDDSDGWYDHVMGPVVHQSSTSDDNLTAPGQCGNGGASLDHQGQCGYGPRLPLLVIPPYSKTNYVDHAKVASLSNTFASASVLAPASTAGRGMAAMSSRV